MNDEKINGGDESDVNALAADIGKNAANGAPDSEVSEISDDSGAVPETGGFSEPAEPIDPDKSGETESPEFPTDAGTLTREFPFPAGDIGTKGVRGRIIRAIKSRGYLGLCFLIPALIMWLIYASMKVYPFGEESVLVLDLNGQYVYYFQALRDIITKGGSLLYSFRRALGGEFLGIIGYYLASPLSVIMALFPEKMLTEALLCMFLIKTGLSGLTFGIYLDRTGRKNPASTVTFSVMYALTAYAVVMQHNTMWIDNLILLPLILLGVENLIKYKKYKLLVICLSIAVFSNFYIGYMTCIFVALYFFYYYYSRSESERNPIGEKNHLLCSFVRMGLCALIVIAITAVMLWSSYTSLTFGKTEFSNPNYDFTQRFDFIDMLSKMYFGSYDTVRPEGLPFLYSGMLTFMLMPLFFFVKSISTREKIATGLFVTVMFISFNGSTLDLFWHGMQRPNWLNYRYSFMLCFLFIVMAHRVFENIDDVGYRPVIASACSISAAVLILQKFELENLPDLGAVWASIAFVAAYLLLIKGVVFPKVSVKKTASLVITIFVCFEMYAAGLSNLMSLDDDVVYSNRTGFRDHIDRYSIIVDAMREMDPSFYRAEKVSHRKTNDNLALGIFGLSNSTSTLNADTIKLLKYMGLASKSHWSKYLGSTPVVDSIFGIKYLIGETSNEIPDMYNEVLSRKGVDASADKTLYVFKNPYAMSVAFGVDESLADIKLFDEDCELTNPFERLNGIMASMLGIENADIFVNLPSSGPDIINLSISATSNHTKYTPQNSNESSFLTYTLTAETTDHIYMYIPTTYDRECKLTVNNASMGTYFGNETHRIVDLGSYEPGTELSVRLELSKENLYIEKGEENYFYYFDEEVFKELAPKLRGSEFNITEWTEDTLIGNISVESGDELIYTSIPYDKGWKVVCDGEEIETFELLDSLVGFRLSPGEHSLSMKYRPDCAVYGSYISIAGIVVFAGFCAADFVIKKRGRKQNPSISVNTPD